MKEADEIVVGANGSIYVGAVDAAIPASIDAPLASADWTDLGYVTEDGVAWMDGKTMQSIRAWQSFYDLRRIVESKEGSLTFSLMQWSGVNVKLAFGGGTIDDSAGAGLYKYVPPDPATIDERAMAVEWSDGAKDYRLVFPKGIVSENVETNLQRTSASLLPITFSLLGQDAVNPFELYTNDPAFADAVGS